MWIPHAGDSTGALQNWIQRDNLTKQYCVVYKIQELLTWEGHINISNWGCKHFTRSKWWQVPWSAFCGCCCCFAELEREREYLEVRFPDADTPMFTEFLPWGVPCERSFHNYYFILCVTITMRAGMFTPFIKCWCWGSGITRKLGPGTKWVSVVTE